jgi:Domain of unknown function (DUF4168)
MAERFQSRSQNVQGNADVSDEMIGKMRTVLVEISRVERALMDAIDSVESEEDKQVLTEQADRAMAGAIRDQGLTITEFNEVVRAADNDPELRQRLTQAVRMS